MVAEVGGQEQELIRIRETLQLAEQDGVIPDTALNQIHQDLTTYECWQPYIRFLERQLKVNPDKELYVRLITICVRDVEILLKAQEVAADAVRHLKLTYRGFVNEILFHVLEPYDYTTEAALLVAAVPAFHNVTDQTQALERVCLIYEKKVPNDSLLHTYYERLLALNSRNIKALRYFKMLHSQAYEWDKVVDVLQTLISAVTRQNEVYRYGQELAGVYLYHLNRPSKAIDTIRSTCQGSPLDTSTLLYDAYHAQEYWEGCLEILGGLLPEVETAREQAILHYKMSGLALKRQDRSQALAHIQQSVGCDPSFLDAWESMISLSIQQKDWANVEVGLNRMTELVSDEVLKSQLVQARDRLREGIANGG